MVKPKKSLTSYWPGISAFIGVVAIGLVVVFVHAAAVVGDINQDGVVNVFDLSILLTDWGTSTAAAP